MGANVVSEKVLHTVGNPKDAGRETMKNLWLALALLFLSACSTSTRVYQRDLSGVTTFSFKAYQFGSVDIVELVINAMENKGYVYAPGNETGIVFTSTGSDANLYNNNFAITAWYQQRPILTVSARNRGFGNLIAPDSAKQNLIDKVVRSVEENIPKASP